MSAHFLADSYRMARPSGGHYNPQRCGQAGQLARGPHAPPAAATFRMGMTRHGARKMDSSDDDLPGLRIPGPVFPSGSLKAIVEAARPLTELAKSVPHLKAPLPPELRGMGARLPFRMDPEFAASLARIADLHRSAIGGEHGIARWARLAAELCSAMPEGLFAIYRERVIEGAKTESGKAPLRPLPVVPEKPSLQPEAKEIPAAALAPDVVFLRAWENGFFSVSGELEGGRVRAQFEPSADVVRAINDAEIMLAGHVYRNVTVHASLDAVGGKAGWTDFMSKFLGAVAGGGSPVGAGRLPLRRLEGAAAPPIHPARAARGASPIWQALGRDFAQAMNETGGDERFASIMRAAIQREYPALGEEAAKNRMRTVNNWRRNGRHLTEN